MAEGGELRCLTRDAWRQTGRMPYHFGYYRNPSDEGGAALQLHALLIIHTAAVGYSRWRAALAPASSCLRADPQRLSVAFSLPAGVPLEAAILPHSPLPVVGASIAMERERQQK